MKNMTLTFDPVGFAWGIIATVGIVCLIHTLDTWRIVLVCLLALIRIEGKS